MAPRFLSLTDLGLMTFCLVLWAGGGTSLQAQVTVEARVVSSYTGERLAGAQLLAPTGAVGALTDSSGMAVLTVPPGPQTLLATHIGYAPDTVPVAGDDGEIREVEIELDPAWLSDLPEIEPGTRLDSLRAVFSDSLELLPEDDGQDRILIPRWFRAYHRSLLPGLPTTGPYQYPHAAVELYNRLLTHQNLELTAVDSLMGGGGELGWTVSSLMGTSQPSGSNINLSNRDVEHRETSIAVDPNEPRYVVAAANNTSSVPGGLAVFRSSDGGICWNSSALPVSIGAGHHADPSVAWDLDGVGWAAALEVDPASSPHYKIGVFRSMDRGATWERVATVSEGDSNDKPMIGVGPGAAGDPSIYVAWGRLDVKGIFFRHSPDGGTSWHPVEEISADLGFGAHIATGPGNEVRVAWRDATTTQPAIRIWRKSDGDVSQVAPLYTSRLRVYVPGACRQPPMIYPIVGVGNGEAGADRVYVSWMDLNSDAAQEPGCSGLSAPSHTNIYVSYRDEGTQDGSWSVRQVVGNSGDGDEFQPWMEVDPANGAVHISFYASESGQRESIRLRHVVSTAAPSTWTGVQVADQPSTHLDARVGRQYGDYSGIAVINDRALPAWTDRRAAISHGAPQTFSAVVKAGAVSRPICPPAQITFDPAPVESLGPNEEISVTVKLTRNGTPVAEEWIGFESSPAEVARLGRASLRTDASGNATLTLRGGERGSAVVSAGALGTVGELAVDVSAECPWWVWALLAGGVIFLALGLYWLLVKKTASWWVWLLVLLGLALLGLAIYLAMKCWTGT